ncbi:DUF3352 domain-containing protein [Herbidospora mongoliensis]|uniref:DUF3352 domain-containing protein n=1 Tax=Herbidospora mongoliensis TaxID=688067 RepID=UPI000829C26D|nr:DUF3352 domain-containing protein [Herbidospora mongoliensis]
MPAENPPGFPFDTNGDPDRTINYRSPQPQPQPQPYAEQPTRMDFGGTQQMFTPPPQQGQWRQPEELGYDLPPVVHAPVEKRRSPKGIIIAVIAAVVVGLVGGGGVWAFSTLSGGGSQPSEALPAGALAYARIDLDPAANQKLALFNIARKFTVTKDAFSGDDPREAFFKAISTDNPNFEKIDYAADIEPWLGDRIGFALMPGKDATQPGFALAIQVKDADAARAGIAKLDAGSDTKTGVAIRGDYAIVSTTQEEADKYATGPTLAEAANFTNDMDALGEPGVLSFWADLAGIAKLGGAASATSQAALAQIGNGRFAGALRFDGSYVELAGITRGIDSKVADAKPVAIGDLPDTTAGAIAVSGIGQALKAQWNTVTESADAAGQGAFSQFVTQAQQQFGLAIPDDLFTLLGDGLTLAIDSEGLDADLPNIGAVLSTDPDKAGAILTKIEQGLAASGQQFQLAKAPGDGKLVVATNQGYADKLASAGALKDSETFQNAVPNADAATFAAFVDLDKVENLYLQGMSDQDKTNLQQLSAVGLSGGYQGSEGNFSLRVLFN